jgi:hypothetical protein
MQLEPHPSQSFSLRESQRPVNPDSCWRLNISVHKAEKLSLKATWRNLQGEPT